LAKLALMSALAAGTASMRQQPNRDRMAERNGRGRDGWDFIAVDRLMANDRHASGARRPGRHRDIPVKEDARRRAGTRARIRAGNSQRAGNQPGRPRSARLYAACLPLLDGFIRTIQNKNFNVTAEVKIYFTLH
jgi:hypothetical protein